MKSEENSRKSTKDFLEISPLLKQILRDRKITSDSEQQDFLNPDFAKTCYDPELFPDIKRAVSRIALAKQNNEKVVIYGDYDIDGMTATVILWETLRRFGLDCETYTPDRFSEGYGLNKDAIAKICDMGAKLIITVDNGTLSFDEIDFAKTLGVDVIVTDHHSPHEVLPNAIAVVNPKIMPARFPEFYDENFCLRYDIFREKLCTTSVKNEQKSYSKSKKSKIKTCKNKHEFSILNDCLICDPDKLIRENYSDFANDLSARDNIFAKINDDEKQVFAKKFYPFCDPCGAGVAFILVRALQKHSLETRKNYEEWEKKFPKEKQNPYLIPMEYGQEKWLLDLVALGTVCDIVGLVDENRNNVKWGIEVMKRTRRPGIRALLAVVNVKITDINSETLGFVLGPRLNAAGRMETAEYALDLLKLHDVETSGFVRDIDGKTVKTQSEVNAHALKLATKMDDLNKTRRKIQDKVFANASKKIDENYMSDHVLVVDGENWHEGIIGIVAAKILEKYGKPTIILAREDEIIEKENKETGEVFRENIGLAKGSGRSFGEFSMSDVIHASDKIIERGGGHLAAGGLTIKSKRISEFRENVQNFYSLLKLKDQEKWLIPRADLYLESFAKINHELLNEINKMQPFGHGNEAPVFEFQKLKIVSRRLLGSDKTHVKYKFSDNKNNQFDAIAFSGANKFQMETYNSDGELNYVNIRVILTQNVWNGRVSIEGRLLHMNIAD